MCFLFSFSLHSPSGFNWLIISVLVHTAQWWGYSLRIDDKSQSLYFSANIHDTTRPFQSSSLNVGKLLGGATTLYCIHSIAGERLYNQSGKWNREHNSFVEKYEYLEKNPVKYIDTPAVHNGT